MLRLRTASPNGPRLRFEAGGANLFPSCLECNAP